MTSKTMKTLEVRNCERWRAWLREHHDLESEWIDSLIKRLDDDRYARGFTTRKFESRWSTTNRQWYAELRAGGRLTLAWLKRAPIDQTPGVPVLRATWMAS